MSGQDTKQRLLNTAIEIAASQGVERATVKRIAQTLDLAEATLYRYYESKDDLLIDAFLRIDERISRYLMESPYVLHSDTMRAPMNVIARSIWDLIFNYLMNNKNETMFLVRFRYSSLYTDEVRARRKAYDGSFAKVFSLLQYAFNFEEHFYPGFTVNYIFEISLSFAEKIYHGRITDSPETREKIWDAILAAVRSVTNVEL